MSQLDTQMLKTNMFSIFLPTFLAIMFAVPMAVAMAYFVIRADHSYALNDQNANTSISAAASVPMCVVPADEAGTEGSSAAGHGHGLVFGPMMPALSTGSISQVSHETNNIYTYYDSFNSGSYNNTQSWTDNNTQSWTDDNSIRGSYNDDNSNQGNPVTTTTTTTNTSNTQSWEDNDTTTNTNTTTTNTSNTQSWEDNDTTTSSTQDNDTNTQSWEDNDTTVTTVEDNDSNVSGNILLPVVI
jgi:hypothetical protein